jgi:hypothetical protein
LQFDFAGKAKLTPTSRRRRASGTRETTNGKTFTFTAQGAAVHPLRSLTNRRRAQERRERG